MPNVIKTQEETTVTTNRAPLSATKVAEVTAPTTSEETKIKTVNR